MPIRPWHLEPDSPVPAFAVHLHGRDLEVTVDPAVHAWHWWVRSPHGTLLADGLAPTCLAAEEAAEDEAMSVHPPGPGLLDRLLT